MTNAPTMAALTTIFLSRAPGGGTDRGGEKKEVSVPESTKGKRGAVKELICPSEASPLCYFKDCYARASGKEGGGKR